MHDRTGFIATNGEKMNVQGKTELRARSNNRKAVISALVSDVVAEDMLLSLQDLIRLEVIHENYQASPSQRGSDVNQTRA